MMSFLPYIVASSYLGGSHLIDFILEEGRESKRRKSAMEGRRPDRIKRAFLGVSDSQQG